jgi:hypothetical protein
MNNNTNTNINNNNDVEIEIYVDEAANDNTAPCDVCRW